MLHRSLVSPPRSGVVLIIVLMLLTLFAAVGLSFALVAQSAATSSRFYREAESLIRPDIDPELLLAYFLGQFIYDVSDDASGVYSALRGHSLARTMYGYHGGARAASASPLAANIVPFNGVGRLYAPSPFPAVNDRQLINYTYYPSDGFLRDPERLGTRPNLRAPRGAYTGGFNAPYTYPDMNSTFLAAVQADGTVLLPSFYRPWASAPEAGQYYDPETGVLNPRWSATPTAAPLAPPGATSDPPPWFKYTVLRPLPALNPGFPPPEDGGGDVKNLVGGPGTLRRGKGTSREYWNNDSSWIDLDFPVMTAPDGRKFKPLFAPLIIDLDNRVNVNIHGNVARLGQAHASNQGWGPWEVNLGRVLGKEGRQEWRNLLRGSVVPPLPGRYGGSPWLGEATSGKPGVPGEVAPDDFVHHFYSQVDFDGYNEQTPTGEPSGPIAMPGFLPGGAPLLSCFPSFLASNGQGEFSYAGYGSRSDAERRNHSLLHNPIRPSGQSRCFAASNMEALLRHGDTGSPALTSEFFRLCPANFADPRVRNLVTTHSFDVDRPGVPPWVYNPQDAAYATTRATLDPDHPELPLGQAMLFPDLKHRARDKGPFDGRLDRGEFGGIDWRALTAALGRVNVNRPLPPYPHQGSGTVPPFGPPLTRNQYGQVAPDMPFNSDFPDGPIWKQFIAAQAARQRLANDIYRRLLAVTGVSPIKADQNPQKPDQVLLTARRWLAQLAVNIVDFIDADEISTPFCFYTAEDSPLEPPSPERIDPTRPESKNHEIQWPLYWVFGTELPHVVINEALAEMTINDPNRAYKDTVRVFVELHNPFPRVLAAGTYQPDSLPVALAMKPTKHSSAYAAYRVLISAKPPATALMPKTAAIVPGPHNDNVLGNPALVRTATTDENFTSSPSSVPAHGPDGPNTPQGFLLLGPPKSKAGSPFAPYDPFETEIPAATPVVRSQAMEYRQRFAIGTKDERSEGIAVVLRRLANPHLPFNGNRNEFSYNPYVTVDYVEGIPVQPIRGAARSLTSIGKLQPCAAHRSQLRGQLPCSFGKQNAPAPDHYDWLVHLDRPLISPMELLHVSGYQPYQLTQRFLTMKPNGALLKFGHRAPWLDEDLQEGRHDNRPSSSGYSSHRLYRLFELLETGPLSAGVAAGGRIPGKININTVWDPETLEALCDAQPSNHFSDADIRRLFQQLVAPGSLSARTQGPGGTPGPQDRPFWPLAVGTIPPGGQYPHGGGISETFLRLLPLSGAGHPYWDYELLTKIANQLTTRSNVFAVWLTVGFFVVTDDATRPVKLGAEIGRAEDRHTRHRMFAVVDRTNLSIASCVSSLVHPVQPPPPPPYPVPLPRQAVALNQVKGVTPFSMAGLHVPWRIDVGSTLVVDAGANQEIVEVLEVNPAAAPPTVTAAFTKPHAAGAAVSLGDTPGEPPAFLKPRSSEGLDSVQALPHRIALTVEIDPRRSNPRSLAGEYDGVRWKIEPGAKLILDVGPNQEVTTVLPAPFVVDALATTGTFELVVAKPHAGDFPITNTFLGNPGAQQRFDPRDAAFRSVVRYVSVID